MIKHIKDLSALQLSALQESGNVGAGHAAIALSQLLGKKIMIAVTKVEVLQFESIVEELTKDTDPIVGIYLKVLGEASGAILFVLKKKPALTMADVLLNQKIGTTKVLMEMEQSALKEAGSILSASYLNSMSEMMKLSLIPTVPQMAYDQADTVIQSVFGALLKDANMIVGIENEFIEASTRIKGLFLYMPGGEAVDVLLKKLGVA
ncbi:MAG: chemotaxis protein CheC [bacterium]